MNAVLLSKVFVETTLGANSEARRTVLFDDTPENVLDLLAVHFGLPVLPEWTEWFNGELRHRGMVEELMGLNCNPIAVKGTKLRLLRILWAMQNREIGRAQACLMQDQLG